MQAMPLMKKPTKNGFPMTKKKKKVNKRKKEKGSIKDRLDRGMMMIVVSWRMARSKMILVMK